MPANTPELARLRWHCRRGMKELDVLLTRFLDTKYDGLSEERKRGFVALLECEDPEIYAWVLGQQVPPTAELKDVIESIRG